MKRSIEPIGNYFKLDANGFLINPASLSSIPEKWKKPIDIILTAFQDHFQDQLHSLYLRGSLLRGTYVEGFSDLDFVGLIHKTIKWEHVLFEKDLEEQLKAEFPYLAALELMVSGYSNDLASDYPALAMILKTQSVCIFGTDIKKQIPKYKIGRSLLLHYKWLESDIKDYLEIENPTYDDHQGIMKMLIRSGFELLIEKTGIFTVDLYPAIQTFKEFYPGKGHKMDLALHYYLNPSLYSLEQKELVLTFGNWLVKEINTVLK